MDGTIGTTQYDSEAEVSDIPNASLVGNASSASNVSNASSASNVSDMSNVSNVSNFRALSNGFSNTTYVLVNVSDPSNPKAVTQQNQTGTSGNRWELVEKILKMWLSPMKLVVLPGNETSRAGKWTIEN